MNENTVLYALSTLAQTCAALAAFAALTRFDQPIRRVSVALITFEAWNLAVILVSLRGFA